jgi:hypothetical protein
MSKHPTICHCATSSGAAMPAHRRPLLTQIMSPEFRPDLALQVIARLEKQIDELERSLAEARS